MNPFLDYNVTVEPGVKGVTGVILAPPLLVRMEVKPSSLNRGQKACLDYSYHLHAVCKKLFCYQTA